MTNNIMIIDDSVVDRKIIRRILEKKLQNIQIFEADNGFDLNNKLVSNNIHTCILDILMPGKNGFEVLKDLKSDESVMDIPVIVCSGIEDKEGIEKALTSGAYDYFSKPLSDDDMKISLPLKVKNAIELMKRNEYIRYLSYHDSLTNLYNRRFYEEEFIRLVEKQIVPTSIIIADINGLKLINDTFGHNKGDELLTKAASAIKDACGKDHIVARWGGDEFIILMPNTKKEEAEDTVKRIKDINLKQQVNTINMSISFGWDTKDKDDQDLAKVQKNAEDYMYRNKTFESISVRSNMINTIIKVLHEKNPREEKHSKRVSEICQYIGEKLDLSEIEVSKLRTAGLLHDIGKIAIEEGILNKPGKLTSLEFEQIKTHPDIGYRILSSSNETLELSQCVLAHHENWDGTGYPKGLKGEEIPRISRVIALADSYDAMTSERSYRASLTHEEALHEIIKNAGTQFDPMIARVFVEKVLNKEWA